jgi:hypothetical protein
LYIWCVRRHPWLCHCIVWWTEVTPDSNQRIEWFRKNILRLLRKKMDGLIIRIPKIILILVLSRKIQTNHIRRSTSSFWILKNCERDCDCDLPRKKVILRWENNLINTQKKTTKFATKSSEIIISSGRAGSTLQKQSLLYKTLEQYAVKSVHCCRCFRDFFMRMHMWVV